MKKIILVTGNTRKIGEANVALKDFNITVEQRQFHIDEIQDKDPINIAKHKAQEAFRLADEPIVITDTSWEIPALNGFPGGYMHDIAEWFSPHDFINLLKSYDDKTISFTETIVYQDKKLTKVFSQKFTGLIADKPKGVGISIEQVAMFNGFTIGERHQQGKFSHDPKEYVWYQFGKWFSDKK